MLPHNLESHLKAARLAALDPQPFRLEDMKDVLPALVGHLKNNLAIIGSLESSEVRLREELEIENAAISKVVGKFKLPEPKVKPVDLEDFACAGYDYATAKEEIPAITDVMELHAFNCGISNANIRFGTNVWPLQGCTET